MSLILLAGCSKQAVKQADQLDQGWTPPVKIAESKDSLVGGVDLYRWQNKIIVFQEQDDHSAKCFLMDSNSDHINSWVEVPLNGVPRGFLWAHPAIDQASDNLFFEQSYIENDQLVMNAFVGHMTGRISVQDAKERKWITDTKTLLGETHPNVRLTERNEPGKRSWPRDLWVGIINGSDLYVPYCLEAFTFDEKGAAMDRGPYCNGVFHSADSGMNWQLERVSDADAALPSVCKTKGYYYYFATSLAPTRGQGRELWFARKSADENSWNTPKVVTKTFCDSALFWKYIAEPQYDIVHLCWLDRRHEKRRANFVGDAKRQNYEIAYCQRKDSDANWSKDAVLSEGMLYSYSPSMSVEGDKVVVAWAGVVTAPDWHHENAPNDIYYRTSRDGGKTWGKLLKATDGVKDGFTAGRPQVALQNGVIHLFYIQGKLNLKQESPGLTKLNQPPWPIYYTQRPFPN